MQGSNGVRRRHVRVLLANSSCLASVDPPTGEPYPRDMRRMMAVIALLGTACTPPASGPVYIYISCDLHSLEAPDLAAPDLGITDLAIATMATDGLATSDLTVVDFALAPDLVPPCLSPLSLCVADAGAHQCVDPLLSVDHCGGCGQACPMRDHTVATCAAGDCQYVCAAGSVDLDGDVHAQPRSAMSTGCECQIKSATDVPDLRLLDSNCDGIDGDVNHAIFVSPRGNDSAAGTMKQPLLTLSAAIAAARAAGKDVYAALGTYNESITLQDGVNLYGGYDDSTPARWGRGLSNVSSILGTTTTAVLANNLAGSVEIQLFEIRSVTGTSSGASSYGVRIVNSAATATVTLRGDTITASDGVAGTSGSDGISGANGANGTGGSGNIGGGPGGTSSCGSAGGDGAAMVSGLRDGLRGGDGKGPGAGTGGSGTTDNPHCGGISADAPDDAKPGSAGSPGVNGSAGMSLGMFDSSGLYLPPASQGGTPGSNAGGGGGGGSGSGACVSTGFPCYCGCCSNYSGGSGGGGGSGGCGGTAGSGATGGGASYAVVAIQSHLVISGSMLNVGHGGNGGAGGSGGVGGSPGSGGAGSAGGSAGAGAPGKSGGTGGAGGSGAGAPGGAAICVVYTNAFAPTIEQSPCTRAGGGAGGSGGSNAPLGAAPTGATGPSVDQLAL